MRRSFLFILVVLISMVPAAAQEQQKADPVRADIQKTFGFVPSYIEQFPAAGLAGAWEEQKALEFGETTIPGKYKSLISLAVASQVPCDYCIYADTAGARLGGATDGELREAIAMAALTRHWSTILNGSLLSEDEFRKEWSQMMKYAQKPTKAAMAPAAVTDAASAYKDIEATLGMVPSFFRIVPQPAIAGAWKAFKGIQLNPQTELPGQYKELIGLAVAAQIPCRYCVYAHTEAAKANGASQEQVNEALTMAALTRQWSTVIQGSGMELNDFKREVDRLFQNVQKKTTAQTR